MLGCGDRSNLSQPVFADGHSEELAFSRALKDDESAVGEGV